MSDNTIEFTKNNIDTYFKELAKEYKKLGGRNIPIEIVLIGGAAIIESYGFRNMTTDIDAILPSIGIMKDAINHIGDKFGLPNGWLNADFMQTSSYSPRLAQFSKPYKTFNQVLNVRYISGEYLIAMKLKSGREYKNDLSDILGILSEHVKSENPITLEQIVLAVNNLYGDMCNLSEKSISFINAVMANGNFSEMYTAIRESEKSTKSFLLAFNEKYPGVLKEDKIDPIIQKNEPKDSVQAAIEKLKNYNKK